MAKKTIDFCDMCETEQATHKIIKGEDKDSVYCEDCLEDWKMEQLDDMYEELEQ